MSHKDSMNAGQETQIDLGGIAADAWQKSAYA
jgi:hypothetical protein